MEKRDTELLLRIVPADARLKKLYQQHQKLEREVARFERYAPYSPSAALHSASLKKRKLRQKDAIMSILHEYRQSA